MKWEVKNIPWWVRLQLYFCKWQCAVDPASIDDIGSIVHFKVLRGHIYVFDMKIVPREKPEIEVEMLYSGNLALPTNVIPILDKGNK